MNTKPLIALLIMAALMIGACAPQQITVSPTPERNSLSVSGQGELEVNPDKAELTLAFVTNATTAKEAQDKNRVLSNAVIDALKATGVKADEIESLDYDLHQLITYDYKDGQRLDHGYELVHRIKVTTLRLSEVGNLVDLSVRNGANRVDSINFGLTKGMERQAKSEALAKAAQEATAKAQSVAANVGVTLGKVMRVSESASYTPYYPSYRKSYEGAAMAMDAAPIEVRPQKLTVSATVNLDYELK